MRLLSLKKRKLLISSLYGAAAASSIAGMIYTTLAGEISGLDLALTVMGTCAWTIAAAQNIYRRAYAIAPCSSDTENQAEEKSPLKICGMHPSTHMKINASLHIVSSTCFIIPDAIKLGRPTLPIITRSAGSVLWLSSAILSLVLANEEEKVESKKIKNIKVCGLDGKYHYLLDELEYFTAAVFYAAAIYSQEINPFKVASNTLWFTASIHDTIQTAYDAFKRDEAENDVTLPQMSNA